MLTDQQMLVAQRVTAEVRERYPSTQPLAAGTARVVPLAGGARRNVTAGVLDADARFAFTNGHCHSMAIALSLRTGLPLVFVGQPECAYDEDCAPFPEEWGWCGCQVEHLGVLTPDGQFLDVSGVSSAAQVAEEVTGEPVADEEMADVLRVVDMNCLAWFLRDRSWRELEVPLALSLTDEILAGTSLALPAS